MKKLMMAAALGGTLLLSGCVTKPEDLIAQIQDYTAKVCAFEPTAASVAALISALVPGAAPAVGIVNMIGDAICRAPTTRASVRRGAALVTKIVQTPRGPVAISGRRL